MNGVEIKELKLNHYGEIGDLDLEFNSGLNSFFGRNESGKTLIVEAMTKMLLEDRSVFQDLNRVDNEPNGLLKVVKNDAELDASQEDLDTIFEGATAEDVRNAFIIRDVDLRLPERKNDFGTDGYFSNVTDRILGSKTQKIQALRREISDIGFLTNDRIEKDPKLKNTQGTGKLRDKKRESEKLSEDIEEFRKEELKGKNILDKYSRLNFLEDKINDLEEKERKLEEAEKEQKYQQGLRLVEELEAAVEKSKDIKKRERKLEKLEDLNEEIIKAKNMDEPVKGLDKEITLVSLGSTVILAISSFLNPLGILGALAALIIGLYYGKQYRSTENQVQEKESNVKQILDKLEAEGFDAETLQDAEKEIEDFKQDLEEARRENDKYRQDKESKLEGKFKESGEGLEDWRDIVESFSDEFEETNLEFSEEEVEGIKEEKQELEEEKQEKEEELDEYNQKINDFNSRFQGIPVQKFTDYSELEIKTVDDLPKARRQLEEFIECLEETVESSVEVLEILEEMESEEEDEFNSLFDGESYAVEMFREATDGNYIDINYDKSSGTLKVERSDGEILEPQKLSQGTYDLLYMSIRLSLAQEIIGDPGFLILDNAFVHSDKKRVRKELEFLKKLEDGGWQIIYFTFREDVKGLLNEIGEIEELDKIKFQ